MPATLAQIDPEILGSWTQVLFFVIGGVGGVLLIIRFFKPNPPEFQRALEAERKERKDDVHQLHGRISTLREEIKGDYEKNALEVRSAAKEMREIYTSTVGQIGEMKGQLRSVDQRTHHIDGKLDRHIEHENRKP